jgi:hypothetical protein
MKNMQEEHGMPMARHYGKKTIRVVIGKKFYWP